MFGVRQHHQIARPVIEPVTVDMVDLLVRREPASDHSLSYEDVLADATARQREHAAIPVWRQSMSHFARRYIQTKLVPVGVTLPVPRSSVRHLGALLGGLGLTGEMCRMWTPGDTERHHTVANRVPAYAEFVGDRLDAAVLVLGGQPFGVVKCDVHGVNYNTWSMEVQAP